MDGRLHINPGRVMVFLCAVSVLLSLIGCKDAGSGERRIELEMVVYLASSTEAGDKNINAFLEPFGVPDDKMFLVPEKVQMRSLECPDAGPLFSISGWRSYWIRLAELTGEVSRERIRNDWEHYLKNNGLPETFSAECESGSASVGIPESVTDDLQDREVVYLLGNNGVVSESLMYGAQRPESVERVDDIWEDLYKKSRKMGYERMSIAVVYGNSRIRPVMGKMVRVEAGSYEINEKTEFLRSYLKMGADEHAFHVKEPFHIQAGEVTVGELRAYAFSGKRKMRRDIRKELEKNVDHKPVEFVSWDMANEYAAWLKGATGQDISLPTVKQWAAAVVVYGESNPALKISSIPIKDMRSEPDHLVGNLREWALDSCGDGKHHLLGESENIYFSSGQTCAIKEWKGNGIGFRLVRNNISD